MTIVTIIKRKNQIKNIYKKGKNSIPNYPSSLNQFPEKQLEKAKENRLFDKKRNICFCSKKINYFVFQIYGDFLFLIKWYKSSLFLCVHVFTSSIEYSCKFHSWAIRETTIENCGLISCISLHAHWFISSWANARP